MVLHLPPELEAKLNQLAKETGRGADELALDLLGRLIEHDEWFRREIEKGLVSAREGRLLDHDEVVSRIGGRYPVE
jgi:predicted transcriptional regulator